MKMSLQSIPLVATMAIVSLFLSPPTMAQTQQPKGEAKSIEDATSRPRILFRIFWQDIDARKVRWGDLSKQQENYLLTPMEVDQHPSLDGEVSDLVQMQLSDDVLVCGVRDHDEGTSRSGWFALQSGVIQEPHGDHFHWNFSSKPKLLREKIDGNQGNPAHLYNYNGHIVIAQDAAGQMTCISPKELKNASYQPNVFKGGGAHITIAALPDQVAYATWPDRDGENQGRVDVLSLAKDASKRKSYSFKLPVGGLHGATANSGKIFFAPSDGIWWTAADTNLQSKPENVKLNHISLGKQAGSETPKRTGAFANLDRHVLFVTGKGSSSSVGILDAQSVNPEFKSLPISLPDESSLSTPVPIRTKSGRSLALVFSENAEAKDEKLLVIDLDSNADQTLGDMKVIKEFAIGKSKISQHSGHHGVAIASKGRFAIISNPGDGTLSLLDLVDLKLTATIQVGGTPTHLVLSGS